MDGQVIRLRLSLMGRPVRNYSFEKSVISVGRDPSADVYVDNPGVSRDHFRLEKSDTGLYQVIDLGSANGTYVNDQMVNTSVVHNNDVIRFGKYTLWVGYEQDRRATRRSDKSAELAAAVGPSHTVVLSRAELGNIIDNDVKSPPVPEPSGGASAPSGGVPARVRKTSTWRGLVFGFVLGTLFGAGAIWILLRH
jgi:predicted component of type VI protein secretion system